MSHSFSRILRDRLPYLGLVSAVLILDRWSKSRVQDSLIPGSMRPVIEGFFDLVHFRNTGVAFGMFSGSDSIWQTVLLSGLAAAAALVVVLYSVRTPASERGLQLALALILAGALGNIYDRVTAGFVTDFLYFHVGSWYWPAFNVADTAISAGVGLMALGVIRNELRSRS